MADVVGLFHEAAFDSADIEILARAYELARKSLHDKGQPDMIQQIIAQRIISAAKSGQRDPHKLCEFALVALGNKAVFER